MFSDIPYQERFLTLTEELFQSERAEITPKFFCQVGLRRAGYLRIL